MQYTSKNYTFSITLDRSGFYIGGMNFALAFDPSAWKEKPRLYRRNPKTFVGFGFFVRMEAVQLAAAFAAQPEGYSAADMATAAAQGFRDGVASVRGEGGAE